jgi:hypothetical protein
MSMHIPPGIMYADQVPWRKRTKADWLTLAKTVAVVTALVGSGVLGYWGGRAIAPTLGQWEIAIVDHHPAPPPRPPLPPNPFTTG